MIYAIRVYGQGKREIYKIGYAKNLERRLEQYFYHYPFVELITTREGDTKLESLLHRALYSMGLKFQKNGKLNEWFCGDLSKLLYVFHLSKSKLEKLIWTNRDKAFTSEEVSNIKSSGFKLFKELYIKFNHRGFNGNALRVTKTNKVFETNAYEVDIRFQNIIMNNPSLGLSLIKSKPKKYNASFSKEVQDFLDTQFYKTNIFENRMKMYCEFMDKYKSNPYILSAILHKTDPKYKTYYDYFGTSGCKSVSYEELPLMHKLTDSLKSSTLRDRLISQFKVGSKYTLKQIKLELRMIYQELGITRTPKATELERYFEVSETKLSDKTTGKRNKGYEILGII